MWPAFAGERVLECLLGGALFVHVQRGHHLHAATEGLSGPELVDELLGDELHPVGHCGVELFGFDACDWQEPSALFNGNRVCVEIALGAHLLQHHVAAGERRFWTRNRVVRRGRLENGSQECGVGWVEVAGGRAEVVLGGALYAVGVVAKVDSVEVRRQDAIL